MCMKENNFKFKLWKSKMPRKLYKLLTEWYCLTIMSERFDSYYYDDLFQRPDSFCKRTPNIGRLVYFWSYKTPQYYGLSFHTCVDGGSLRC